MTPTPVGMRCPECAGQRTRVVQNPTGARTGFEAAPATFILIAINVIVFLAEIGAGSGGLGTLTGNAAIDNFGLLGTGVAEGEVYRLLTGGFLHAGLFHIGLNMVALYFLGRLLEPAIGTPRFVVLYFASLFAGSFGALEATEATRVTVGASGAIFGLFGAAFVIARGRNLNAIAAELGVLLLINLAFTFGARDISVGGHIGGLIGGVLCALVIVAGERGRLGPRRLLIELLAMGAVGVLSIVGGIAVA
jgi:membrane associated rhomboid family serine protease